MAVNIKGVPSLQPFKPLHTPSILKTSPTMQPKLIHRRTYSGSSDSSYDSYSSCSISFDTFQMKSLQGTSDPQYTLASSVVEDEVTPTFEKLQAESSKSHLSAHLCSRSSTASEVGNLAPPRPPRDSRRVKKPTNQAGSSSTLKMPVKHYCYDPFVEYELPRSSFDSNDVCVRADSLDLDPDFRSGAGIFVPQVFASCGSPDSLSSRSWLTPSLFSTQSEQSSFDYDATVTESSYMQSTDQLCPVPAASASHLSVASASNSSGTRAINGCEIKQPTRSRSPALLSARALLSSAIKRVGGGASSDSELSSKLSWSRLYSQSSESQPSLYAAPTNARLLPTESYRPLSPVFYTPPSSPTPTIKAIPPATSPKVDVMQSRYHLWKAVDRKAAQTLVPGAIVDVTAQDCGKLPSYHRNLRKQMHPPRVRYEVRELSTDLTMEKQIPPLPLNVRHRASSSAKSRHHAVEEQFSSSRRAFDATWTRSPGQSV